LPLPPLFNTTIDTGDTPRLIAQPPHPKIFLVKTETLIYP
jgi:hypothetical protein